MQVVIEVGNFTVVEMDDGKWIVCNKNCYRVHTAHTKDAAIKWAGSRK